MDWETNWHAMRWGALFEFHSIKHDLNAFPPPDVLPEDTWIFVPAQLTTNEVCRLFKRTILSHNVGPFIAPSIVDGITYKLSDKISRNERDTSNGSYSHTVRTHFTTDERGRLERIGVPDENMTLVEAMLYHTLHIHLFGIAYFYITSGGHYCKGSRGRIDGKGNAVPYLRWDMGGNKICLDF